MHAVEAHLLVFSTAKVQIRMLLYVCCHLATVPHRLTIARPCVLGDLFALFIQIALSSSCLRQSIAFAVPPTSTPPWWYLDWWEFFAPGARTNYLNNRFALYYYIFFVALFGNMLKRRKMHQTDCSTVSQTCNNIISWRVVWAAHTHAKHRQIFCTPYSICTFCTIESDVVMLNVSGLLRPDEFFFWCMHQEVNREWCFCQCQRSFQYGGYRQWALFVISSMLFNGLSPP